MCWHSATRLAPFGLLLVFALQMHADGSAITVARADDSSENLYPGQYAANCKPASIGGCVCETDPAGEVLTPSRLTNETDNHNSRIRNAKYLRMIEWLRLTCNAIFQSEAVR
jgi:hypothetical protein